MDATINFGFDHFLKYFHCLVWCKLKSIGGSTHDNFKVIAS